MTGHGYFSTGSLIESVVPRRSGACIIGGGRYVSHAYGCKAFERDRERLVLVIGPFDLDGLIPLMLKSPSNWATIILFATDGVAAKEDQERERQDWQGISLLRWSRRRAVRKPRSFSPVFFNLEVANS